MHPPQGGHLGPLRGHSPWGEGGLPTTSLGRPGTEGSGVLGRSRRRGPDRGPVSRPTGPLAPAGTHPAGSVGTWGVLSGRVGAGGDTPPDPPTGPRHPPYDPPRTPPYLPHRSRHPITQGGTIHAIPHGIPMPYPIEYHHAPPHWSNGFDVMPSMPYHACHVIGQCHQRCMPCHVIGQCHQRCMPCHGQCHPI